VGVNGQPFTVKTEGESVLLLAALATIATYTERKSA